jgi:four helix bundle protein
LNISLGSAYELETELLVAFNAQYLSQEQCEEMRQQIVEIQKMLYALIRKYNV